MKTIDFNSGDPYENLANAIILQAMKDYKYGTERNKRDAVRFFESEWYSILTNLPASTIIKLCNDPSIAI